MIATQSACKAMAENPNGRGFAPAILRTVAALFLLDAWSQDGQYYGYYPVHQNDDDEEMGPEDIHYLVPREGVPYCPEVLIAKRSAGSADGPEVRYRRNRPSNYVKRYCYRFAPELGGWVLSAKSNVALVSTVVRIFSEMAASAPSLGPESRKTLLLEVAGRLASRADGVSIQPPTIR